MYNIRQGKELDRDVFIYFNLKTNDVMILKVFLFAHVIVSAVKFL